MREQPELRFFEERPAGVADVRLSHPLSSALRRAAPQRSLPPCGGGTGRGVTANTEAVATPLTIPPPQGGREESAARAAFHRERLVCGNPENYKNDDRDERPARASSFRPHVVRLILKLLM